jgi:hypothetical protein
VLSHFWGSQDLLTWTLPAWVQQQNGCSQRGLMLVEQSLGDGKNILEEAVP